MRITHVEVTLLLFIIMTISIVKSCLADSNIINFDAGSGSTFIVQADGSVWSCGSDYGGKLGDSTTTDRCVLGPTLIDNVKKSQLAIVA